MMKLASVTGHFHFFCIAQKGLHQYIRHPRLDNIVRSNHFICNFCQLFDDFKYIRNSKMVSKLVGCIWTFNNNASLTPTTMLIEETNCHIQNSNIEKNVRYNDNIILYNNYSFFLPADQSFLLKEGIILSCLISPVLQINNQSRVAILICKQQVQTFVLRKHRTQHLFPSRESNLAS